MLPLHHRRLGSIMYVFFRFRVLRIEAIAMLFWNPIANFANGVSVLSSMMFLSMMHLVFRSV